MWLPIPPNPPQVPQGGLGNIGGVGGTLWPLLCVPGAAISPEAAQGCQAKVFLQAQQTPLLPE